MRNLISPKKLLLSLITFTIVLLLPAGARAQDTGLGLSPPYIRNDVLLPGTTYRQKMTISRANPTSANTAKIEMDDSEINDWISFEPGTEFVLPEGQQRFEITAIVKVPKDADKKTYNATGRVVLTSIDISGQVIILPGVQFAVLLTVTDEKVENLEVKFAEIPDFPTNKKLGLNLRIENAGNTDTSPTRVEVDVLDLQQNKIITLKSDDLDKVKAYETEIITEFFKDHGLEPNTYFADVRVYLDDDMIFDKKISFEVTGEQSGIDSFASDLSTGQKVLIGLGIAGLLGLFFWFILGKRRKKDDEEEKSSSKSAKSPRKRRKAKK
jgi:hypothetical protein